jgi:pimeloyl-ACP methyl ester carboxylesterase
VKPPPREHHLIYIPGLGDGKGFKLDQRFIKIWRLYGLVVSVHCMGWAIDEPFQVKLNGLLDMVDNLHEQGVHVSLLGFSAGGSAIINALQQANNKIEKVVCISGKIFNPGNVDPTLYEQNPAFRKSVRLSDQNARNLTVTQKKKILTVYPIHDAAVPYEDAVIPGTELLRTIGIDHITSVATALMVSSPQIISFIKHS